MIHCRLGKTYNHDPENRLNEFRTEAGLSQSTLAKIVGATVWRISGLELGRTSIFNHKGEILPFVLRVCSHLEKKLSDIFPREICDIARQEITIEQAAGILFAENKPLSFLKTKDEYKKNIRKLLMTLTEREERIVFERFYNNRTINDIAGLLSLSQGRIRQLEGRALRKLRHPSRSRHIDGWEMYFNQENNRFHNCPETWL